MTSVVCSNQNGTVEVKIDNHDKHTSTHIEQESMHRKKSEQKAKKSLASSANKADSFE